MSNRNLSLIILLLSLLFAVSISYAVNDPDRVPVVHESDTYGDTALYANGDTLYIVMTYVTPSGHDTIRVVAPVTVTGLVTTDGIHFGLGTPITIDSALADSVYSAKGRFAGNLGAEGDSSWRLITVDTLRTYDGNGIFIGEGTTKVLETFTDSIIAFQRVFLGTGSDDSSFITKKYADDNYASAEAADADSIRNVEVTDATPTDGYVLKYEADSSRILWAEDATGGGGASDSDWQAIEVDHINPYSGDHIFLGDSSDTVMATFADSMLFCVTYLFKGANEADSMLATWRAAKSLIGDSVATHWAVFTDTVEDYREAVNDTTQAHWDTWVQTDEEIQDLIGLMLTGNTETGITVTYQDGDATIDFEVDVKVSDSTAALADSADGGAIRSETSKLADSTSGGAARAEVCGEADSTDGGAIRAETAKVADSAITVTDAKVTAVGDTVYQPLEATLTDIADGTINENLVNTANPWADNEVANDITIDNATLADSANGGAIRAETCKEADSTDGGAIRAETAKTADDADTAGTDIAAMRTGIYASIYAEADLFAYIESTVAVITLSDSADGGAIRSETCKEADSTDGGATRATTAATADTTDGGATRAETSKLADDVDTTGTDIEAALNKRLRNDDDDTLDGSLRVKGTLNVDSIAGDDGSLVLSDGDGITIGASEISFTKPIDIDTSAFDDSIVVWADLGMCTGPVAAGNDSSDTDSLTVKVVHNSYGNALAVIGCNWATNTNMHFIWSVPKPEKADSLIAVYAKIRCTQNAAADAYLAMYLFENECDSAANSFAYAGIDSDSGHTTAEDVLVLTADEADAFHDFHDRAVIHAVGRIIETDSHADTLFINELWTVWHRSRY